MAVKTATQLEQALDRASRGDEVEVAFGAHIDATGHDEMIVPHGATVYAGDPDAREWCAEIACHDENRRDHVLRGRRGGNLVGLRFRGPSMNREPLTRDGDRYLYTGAFFYGNGQIRVQGCEFVGWPLAGLYLGSRRSTPRSIIQDNTFTHCLMDGYGYGLELFNGHMVARRNKFDWTRHAISAFGYPTCSYEAYGNVVGPSSVSHAFDMHRVEENLGAEKARRRGFDPQTAGGRVLVHRNRFNFDTDLDGRAQEAIAIRGVPRRPSVIALNDFAHDEPPTEPGGQGSAFRQQTVGEWTNLVTFRNRFHGDRP